MNAKEINPLEYIYDKGAVVEVPGDMIYALITLLGQVVDSETIQGFSHSYSTSAKEVKDGDLIVGVELETEQYPTAHSFFSQKPITATSLLGVMAQDLQLLLKQQHLEEIEKGNAKKIGTVKTPQEDGKVIKLT